MRVYVVFSPVCLFLCSQNMKLEILRRVRDGLRSQRPREFKDCVSWARCVFEDLFVNGIKQLLHSYPVDFVTSAGVSFWSGAKRPPTPLEFNMEDPLHLEFIKAASNLRAFCYGLGKWEGEEYYMSVLPTIVVPVFEPSSNVKVATTEEEEKAEKERQAQMLSSADVDSQCSAILTELANDPNVGPPGSGSGNGSFRLQVNLVLRISCLSPIFTYSYMLCVLSR